jgi:hypothetical protein
MLRIPLQTISDIEQLLNSGVREGTLLEFKEQFPSRLAKSISSMANTYGGVILIGVQENTTGAGVVPVQGVALVPGLRERVVEIGINAIYPPVIPEVRVVEFKSSDAAPTPDRAVVIIRVDESEEGGHAVDGRTAVYIRTDNISDPMRKATVEEMEWFQHKREKSRREKSRVLENAQRHAQLFLQRLRERHSLSTSYPKGRFAFWTVPTFPRAPIATPKELYAATQHLLVPMPTGVVSAFPAGSPRPIAEGIYWGNELNADYCFTEIQQQGMIYSEFGFWWDEDAVSPQQVFFPSAAATFLHAGGKFALSLYRKFGYLGLFDFHFRVAGVKDRQIAMPRISHHGVRMMDDVTEVRSQLSAASDEANLLESAKSMLRDLYWAFGLDVAQKLLDNDFAQ